MKSPITGKPMQLSQQSKTLVFRKENFEVVHHYYACADSGEQFTTAALDEINTTQLYNQYREKHHILFAEAIKNIRLQYNVPAIKMSEILGFGANSYRLYEDGEMPSESNAKLIQMVNDPVKFLELVNMCDTLDAKTKEKYSKQAHQLLLEKKQNNNAEWILYLLGNTNADIYSGYKIPSLEKFAEMVKYFSEKMKPYKTKLNKVLWYADFLMFKQSCFSISGMRYKAINMGPVPNNFNSIFEYLSNERQIAIKYTNFEDGNTGEQFLNVKDAPFNANIFTDSELKVMQQIAAKFKTTSTNSIIEQSHLEKAWKENEKSKNMISYNYAFQLSQI
jgi:DNA-binding transcriptional regulator YiaG